NAITAQRRREGGEREGGKERQTQAFTTGNLIKSRRFHNILLSLSISLSLSPSLPPSLHLSLSLSPPQSQRSSENVSDSRQQTAAARGCRRTSVWKPLQHQPPAWPWSTAQPLASLFALPPFLPPSLSLSLPPP